MKLHKILLSILLVTVSFLLGHAVQLKSYEYWIDDDFDGRQTVFTSQEEIFASIDLESEENGVHFFNIRFANSENEISSPIRYLFYIPDATAVSSNNLIGYEYWLDDDYSSKTTVSDSDEEQSFIVDLSNVESGVHFLNYRGFAENGVTGSPIRYLFYIPDATAVSSNSLKGYEYWLDDDYSSKTTVSDSDEEQSFIMDLSNVESGVHFLNYRGFAENGVTGSPVRYLFYIPDATTLSLHSLAGYEYWLDDKYESRTYVADSGEEQTMLVDLKDLSSGVHFFNYRAFADDGVTGSLSRYLFYIPDNYATADSGIVGYEYSFNNNTTYVPIAECDEFEMNATSIPIPDIKEIATINSNCRFSFADGKANMSQNAEISFLLRFRNSGGESSVPVCHEFSEEYSLSKDIMDLQLQKTVLFDKVTSGDFQAVKFDIPSSAVYYLRSTQSCEMFIMDGNGKIKTTISAANLFKTFAVSLTAGTYYGIIFNTANDSENTEKQVGLRLMTTNNAVPTPEIKYENEVVTMTCLQDDATIYYTLDGSMPDETSIRYAAPFELRHNAEIKAVAKAHDYADSYIATLKIDSYKVDTPVIQFANLKIYITCATPESRIYYTIDGSNPETNGQLYNDAVPMQSNCTVKAVAKRDNYNNSDIAEFYLDISNVKCGTPTLTINGNLLTMSTITSGASIYYTTDGSVPTGRSTLYRSPILLERNARYRAVASKDGEIDSDIAEITVDWFNAEIPEFSFADGKLTMSCKTPESVIYYEIGGVDPSVNSPRYTVPISLNDNRIVKAFAVADGFNNSEVVSYSPSSFTCAQPTITFDGRAITLTSSTENSVIYYTIDGSNPGVGSNVYAKKVVLPGLCTVKAVAIGDNMNNSPVLTYILPSYYNGEEVYVQEAGALSKAFEWCGGSPNDESVKINGNLNDSDFGCIRGFKSTLHLDLGSVSLQTVPEKAFENMNLLTVVMPEVHFNAGSKIMSGCKDLAAIVWDSNTSIPLDILDGMDLPNMLLYVKYAAVANAQFGNIIVNDVADRILLSDSENSNFYAPMPFTARQISYTHCYTQKSGYDRCTGWESIALPFAPTSITHETRGSMAPFAANDPVKKPFWLCELTSTGFVSAESIEANTPYIIAMPDNDNYSDEYILSGNVTFAGSNVRVESSDVLNTSSKGNNIFVPNFTVTPKDRCMALNVGEIYNGHAEGSLFALGLRNARPFEAYVTNPMAMSQSKIFRISFDSSEVMMQSDNTKIKINSEGKRLKVSGLNIGDIIDIVSLEGVRICHEIATDNLIYIDKPILGPAVITIHRHGEQIYNIKSIL